MTQPFKSHPLLSVWAVLLITVGTYSFSLTHNDLSLLTFCQAFYQSVLSFWSWLNVFGATILLLFFILSVYMGVVVVAISKPYETLVAGLMSGGKYVFKNCQRSSVNRS